MEDILTETFLRCDRNRDEEVRNSMLHDYAEEHYGDNDDVMGNIGKLETEGTISLEDYCAQFGLDEQSVRSQRYKYAEDQSQIDSSVNIVALDDAMTIDVQVYITDNMIEAMNSKPNPKEAARAVKQALDKKYNRLWHVIVVQGQYWSYISHEPGWSIVFKVGRYIFLCWRTPGY